MSGSSGRSGRSSSYRPSPPLLPAAPTAAYDGAATAQFDRVISDAVMNAGLPPSFTITLDNYAGTESLLQARPGATVFYHSSLVNYEGVLGWSYGSGRVVDISIVAGPIELADPNFSRLLANAFTWSTGGSIPCYANCDASTTQPILNVLDFTCFLNRFAAADAYANCDGSTTAPVLNVLDFTCFLNRFSTGCS